MPRLSKGGAKAEQTGCVRWMATLQLNCGHSGFHFLPIAHGKECYPPRGEKKNRKLPYLPAHRHRLPNFTGEPRAVTGKELRCIFTLSAFSMGSKIFFSRSYAANRWSNRGQAGAVARRYHSHAHNTETGAARSECRAGDSVPC